MAVLGEMPLNVSERDLRPWRPCMLCGEHLVECYAFGETVWSHPSNGCLLTAFYSKKGYSSWRWNAQMGVPAVSPASKPERTIADEKEAP